MLQSLEEKQTKDNSGNHTAKAFSQAQTAVFKKRLRSAYVQFSLFFVDLVLLNLSFLLAYQLRYLGDIPKTAFEPYQDSFIFLSFIFMLAFSFCRVFKNRFCSRWEIFTRISYAVILGSLFGITMFYLFRIKWSTFPSSIFFIAFPLTVLFTFIVNTLVLKFTGHLKRKLVVIGKEDIDYNLMDGQYVDRFHVTNIDELMHFEDIDEVIICDSIRDERQFNLLIYLLLKLRVNVVFSPAIYAELLSNRFKGIDTVHFLSTFIGKRSELEEFFTRMMDIVISSTAILFLSPVLFAISLAVKLTSKGPAIYRQPRAGKDGKPFIIYKFRTMINNSEHSHGLKPASDGDKRITKIGRFLRKTRLDETPQLFNVLKGDMSLVGPRPENLYRVEKHDALKGLRLAVKPGLTGLAQIRGAYDLHPQHKLKYDYLYIQRRSLLLNIYILLKTIPVVLACRGV